MSATQGYNPGTPEYFGDELASVYFLEMIGKLGDYQRTVVQAHKEWKGNDATAFTTSFLRKLASLIPITLGQSIVQQVATENFTEDQLFQKWITSVSVDLERLTKMQYPNLEFKMTITRRDGQL
jgi:hypothetical protein